MLKNKFKLKTLKENTLIFVNFFYFQLYIYNLKFFKIRKLVINLKNFNFEFVLKLIHFKLLKVLPLVITKGRTFSNLKCINFNTNSKLKFFKLITNSISNVFLKIQRIFS